MNTFEIDIQVTNLGDKFVTLPCNKRPMTQIMHPVLLERLHLVSNYRICIYYSLKFILIYKTAVLLYRPQKIVQYSNAAMVLIK